MNHLSRFNKKKSKPKMKYFIISLLKLFWGTFEGFFDLFSKTKLSDQNMHTEYCFLSLASHVFCYGTAAIWGKIINMLAGPFSIESFSFS